MENHKLKKSKKLTYKIICGNLQMNLMMNFCSMMLQKKYDEHN